MAAQPNIAGMARLLYVVAGLGIVAWGLWGIASGWERWGCLTVGGAVEVLGLIGYSPLHAMLLKDKDAKAS